jgi:Ser/Thr protein kinase RdoA (MazF antagonist)
MPPRDPKKRRKVFPVANSILCPNAIVQQILIPVYGLPAQTTCRFHNFGLNDTFTVECPDAKYVFRVYRTGWRSNTDIAYELDVLKHLNAKGVQVATPVTRLDGSELTTIATPEGERSAALFHFAPGRELKEDDTDSGDFGRSCAQMHAASDDFVTKHKRFKLDLKHLLDDPAEFIRPHLVHRPKDRSYIQSLADRLRSEMDKLDSSSLDIGFCHGDFHGGNVHREGDLLMHFDFDCCGHGWRAYDVAVYRWVSWYTDDDVYVRRWRAFLAGYCEIRKLSDMDLAAIEIFIPMREIWMMGLHLHGGPRWGFSWLGEKYFDRHLKNLREMEAEFLNEPPLFSKSV